MNDRREIAVWVRVADAYERFAGRVRTAEGRRDLYRVLLSCANGVRETAHALPRELADEAADYLCRPLTAEEGEAMAERFLSGGGP